MAGLKPLSERFIGISTPSSKTDTKALKKLEEKVAQSKGITSNNNTSTNKVSGATYSSAPTLLNGTDLGALERLSDKVAREKGSQPSTTTKSTTTSTTTQKPKTYSEVVKYLESKGYQGASSIMTENEWRRRNKTGTYQNYLDDTIKKYDSGNASTEAYMPRFEKHDDAYWEKRYYEEVERLKTEHANDPAFPVGAHASAIVDEEMEREEYLLKHQDNTYKDNFWGQFAASFRSGDVAQKINKAEEDYWRTGDESLLEYRQNLINLNEKLRNNNKEVYADDAVLPEISQDFAGYIPQLRDRTIPQAIGGVVGTSAGVIAGAFTPGGAGVIPLAKAGGKIGATLASGTDSYDSMRASAYFDLLELGADEETARAAASDEAFISAMLEMGDTWFTLSKFGYGAVLNLIGKGAVKETAKGGLRKVAEILGKYGLNIEQERFEEGTQGAISVANRRRVYNEVTRRADAEIGQYGKGNIDLYNRPKYKNQDGTISTVESALFNIDGEYILLPTVDYVDYGASGLAIKLTDDQAIQRYLETGEYLGKFETQEEADEYAKKLHLAQDYYYSDSKDEYSEDGKWGLTKDAAKVLLGVDFGTEDEETINEIKEQKRAGGVIAAVMGIPGTAFDVGATSYVEAHNAKAKKVVDTVVNMGLETNLESEAHKKAEAIKVKRDAGETITKEELVETAVAIEREMQTTQPDTLEQAAMDVVASRNATETSKTQPISNVSATDDSLPTQRTNTPTTAKNARRGISLSEQLEAQSRANEPLSVADVKKATGFGDEGSKLVTELANKEGVTFSQAERMVKTAYLTGFTDVKTKDVSFDNPLQKAAFDAGKVDIGVQNRAKLAEAKKASVYKGAFHENEYTKNFTRNERRMIATVAKSLKMDISVVDKVIANVVNGRVYEANAEHIDGKMRISNNRDASMVIYGLVMHEGGHRMRQLAPAEFGGLMNALYERAVRRGTKSGASQNSVFDYVKSQHDNAGITMDTSSYIEEIAVRELETIFSSAREFNKWYAEISGNPQVRTNFEKFVDWVLDVIDDIKRAIKQANMSKEERAKANAELDRIKGLLANAYKAAENAATERANAQGENAQNGDSKSNANFSLKKVDGKNIVWIEESGLTNKQLNNHQAVAEYIAQHIGEVYTIIESGQKVYIGEDLPQEYTHSKYTAYLRGVNQTAARGKNKAIDGFGELIETATNRRWEKTRHTDNKDAKYGMYRYDNSFAFPIKDNKGNVANVRAFDVELLIRNASDGNKYLYDIVAIEENTTAEIGLLERMTRMPNKSQATRDSVSNDKIPQNPKSVKGVFSATTDEGLDGGKKYSLKVKDQKTIAFLENQEHITTYKAMQLIDGKLYPPMAAKTKGADGKYHLTNPSELGAWQRAVEDPANIKISDNKDYGYYVLNKGDGSSVTAAYNPYEHSSNLVLNDQFEGAYKRDNLVTVECVIPKSEMTSGYKARHAKDSTGVLDWKSGVVAGKIKDNKRKVYLSRWLKPVRILTDAETAKMYKDALGDSNVSVPFNVITPSLLSELEKIGVSIDHEGSPMYKSNQERNKAKNTVNYSLKDSEGNTLTEEQQGYFKDSKVRDENGNLLVMYQGAKEDFTVFDRKKSSYANLYGRGFYFTKSENHASQYGNTRAYYLNIKHPVSTTETTITKSQLRKFLQAVIENEDYSFENYGYGATVDSVLQSVYGKSDFLMLNDVSQTAIGDLVEAVELFNEINGTDYDGIMLDTETVTFNSEQAKLTTNEEPTTNPDIRFSLKEPVEETKDLIAVHNLWEEKLLKSLNLGGLPMPSIAIVRAKEGHSNFGNISLVFRKETISPTDRRNKVYSGDAWTPTYPHIEYKLNETEQSKIEKKIDALVPKDVQRVLGGLYLDSYNMEESLNRHGDLASTYNNNYAMKYAFLSDSGIDIELPMKDASLSSGGRRSDEAIIKVAETVPEEVLRNAIYGENNDIRYESEPVIRKAVSEAIKEKYNDKPEVVKALLPKHEEELSLGQLMGYAEDALRYKEEGVKQEVDYKEACELINEKTDASKYEKWLKELFSDVIAKEGIRNDKDLFTSSGNRRSFEALHYEHTLENVVKAMKESGSIGIGGFGGNNILGSSAVEYGSIGEIKEKANERMKSLPQEEYDKIREGFTDRFLELANSLPIHKTFSSTDDAANMLCEAVMKYKTKSGMANYLRNESKGWANYSDHIVDDLVDLVNDIRNMPTSYFEAKPQRAVGFNEIVTAIIPDNVSEELKTKLTENNVQFIEYEHGNNDARLEALNSLEDVQFSLKGGMSATELFDTVDDARKGKKKAINTLSQYVKDGVMSTELYEELIEKYGAIPSGEKPHRDIQVPRKSGKNKKVSQTVRTILEAQATPDEAVPTIEKMVEDGIFSYDVYTDKQAIADSENYIKEYGWDESLDDWFDAVKKGEVSKELTAMGWALYNNAANLAATTTSETEKTTAIKTSLKILDAMVRHQRSAAQALQATRILKKLSPETQLYGVQKSVNAFQNELTERYGDKAPKLKIDEELAEQFLNAKTEEERAAIEEEIFKDIGRQMPSRFIDKWNAWRYLAMLGNVRTHVRNIIGNAFFAPIVGAKNLTATAIETIVYRVSGKKMVRGKALVWGSKADKKLLKAAWGDYANVADMISNGGKYSDFAVANQKIEEGRQIFKFKPLEWARKGNSKALEAEDMWFSKPHYAYALAQYCKANNISVEQIKRGKAIAPARDYAIKEAQKATYRDTNAFSQMVSGWGRNNKNEKNVVKKAFNTVVEGILPFRKTPANILVRGVEYSPLGLLKGLSYDLVQVGKGKMTASEAIDNISAGLTGTGLLALGVYLAAQGLVRGHGEDDKEEKEFKELMGHQAYALELPNGDSITLDWLAPEALPFFVGVNIWESTKGSDEEANLSTILKSISNISEPMLEMSCLQSLNDLFEGIGYASSNDTSGLVSIISSAATSYLTQGLPTLLGQAERTGEENRMTTYTEKDDFLTGDTQYTLGKASAKIPFWDYHQIPYIDAWGRKEVSGVALKRGFNNFLNPAYTSTIETSDMENELLRLYEETGEGGVFPSRADKKFTVDGEEKYLTADEYVRYATLKGEKSYKLVSDLVKSKSYKKLSDEEKAKAVKEAYDYANQKAKQTISNYKPDTWVKKADEFGANVGNYISFKTEVSGTKEDNGGKISKQEVVDIILDMAQNDSETWKMYLSMYDSEKDYYAYDEGIKGETYMHFLEALNEADEPTKSGEYGTYTQDEAKEAVNSLDGLTQAEKRALWQSVNTGWKKNPF